ncbi:MAG: adenosylcobinamide amidohydrolase [Pseudomonadota bacterium]
MNEQDNARPRDLMHGVRLSCDADHVHLRFATPMRALSSAVYHGGFTDATDFINLRVPKDAADCTEDPEVSMRKWAEMLNCHGRAVGMMTAASISSMRVETVAVEQEQIAVVVTSGLDNARRAGDRAELRRLNLPLTEHGTINTAIVTSARLEQQAMVEVLAVAVEAKAAVLQEMAIYSPISGGLATGTGTDAIAIFSHPEGARVRFAGKHTLLGEQVAKAHIRALRSSMQWSGEASA